MTREEAIVASNSIILNTAAQIKTETKKVLDRLSSTIVSRKKMQLLIDELEFSVKSSLVSLFGGENDIDDYGILGKAFLDYQTDLSNGTQSMGVLFTYDSVEGEREIYTPKKDQHVRGNLFYKGTRWSNEASYARFYVPFKRILRALPKDNPLDFLKRYAPSNCRHLVISRSPDYSLIQNAIVLQIPSLSDVLVGNGEVTIKVRQKLNLLQSVKDNHNLSGDVLARTVSTLLGDDQQFKTELGNICDDPALWKFDSVYLDKMKRTLNSSNDPQFEKRLRCMVVPFDFYDHPYDIHMFLCTTDESVRRNRLSALVITQPQDSKQLLEYRSSLCELASALEEFAVAVDAIEAKHENTLPIYWAWRDHHAIWSQRYERLSSMAISICSKIAQDNRLQVAFMPHRVKEFDSLFEKIVEKANTSMDPSLRKSLEKASEEDAVTVFSGLRDFAGVRVISLYKDALDIFNEAFLKLRDKGELDFNDEDLIPYKQSRSDRNSTPENDKTESQYKFNYRGLHLTFQIGKARSSLYEFADLVYLKCEVQVRTVLAHAWAEIEHKLKYKSHLSQGEKSQLHEDFNSTFGEVSAALLQQDKVLFMLRNQVDQIVRRRSRRIQGGETM